MHMKKILIPLILLVLLLSFPKRTLHVEPYHPSGEKLFNLVNQYRGKLGLPPVKEDLRFCEYAKERSQEISTDWSHDQFLVDGEIDGKKYTEVCPECETTGENLGRETNFTEERVLQAWINSPGHRSLLENTTYDIGCVGIYQDTWVVLEFGNLE